MIRFSQIERDEKPVALKIIATYFMMNFKLVFYSLSLWEVDI